MFWATGADICGRLMTAKVLSKYDHKSDSSDLLGIIEEDDDFDDRKEGGDYVRSDFGRYDRCTL